MQVPRLVQEDVCLDVPVNTPRQECQNIPRQQCDVVETEVPDQQCDLVQTQLAAQKKCTYTVWQIFGFLILKNILQIVFEAREEPREVCQNVEMLRFREVCKTMKHHTDVTLKK